MKMVPEAEAYYSKHQYAILYLVPEFDEAVIFTQRSVYSYPEFILYHSVDEASRDFFRAVQRDRFVPEALRRGVEGARMLLVPDLPLGCAEECPQPAHNPRLEQQLFHNSRLCAPGGEGHQVPPRWICTIG